MRVPRLKSSPNTTNPRLIVDSQRLVSSRLAPFEGRIDVGLAQRWEARAATYTKLQRELRDVGGRLGEGGLAAAEGANAVTRLGTIPADAIIEPRVLSGFQTLFATIDAQIADIVESGVERGAFVKRLTVPRLVTDLDVVQTVRNELRPQHSIEAVGPGPTRADLHAALVHRPTNGEINHAPHL